MLNTPPTRCKVLVVGAGVAGASAAFHLSRYGAADDVCVLEVGNVGRGSGQGKPLVDSALLSPGDDRDAIKHENAEDKRVFTYARSSGTAVFDNPLESTIKMIVNVFPCSVECYKSHHGEAGARSYLRLAHKGLEMEKQLAQQVLQDPSSQLTCLGSLYVCLVEDVVEFEQEFLALQSLGAKDIEWWDSERTQQAAGPAFSRGIFFPHDAVIDSSAYAEGLLRSAVGTGKVRLIEGCSPVVRVESIKATALTSSITTTTTTGTDSSSKVPAVNEDEMQGRAVLQDGSEIVADWIVLATGGLFMEPALAGILTPCWSYLVSIPEPQRTTEAAAVEAAAVEAAAVEADTAVVVGAEAEANCQDFRLQSPNSTNFFTWNFTHDWCLTKGYLRCSGEDHYSALKPPRSMERCAALTRWTLETLPYLRCTTSATATASSDASQDILNECDYTSRYGVYSETPDHSPLIGCAHPSSKVCYLLGCNAWGQAVLSFAASLVPALLGFDAMTEEDREDFKVLDVKRYALLDAVIREIE